MERPDNWRRTLFIGGLLSAATLATFWPVVHNEFVFYDDPDYVLANPHVAGGLSWASLIWAFRAAHSANWHPLTWLSHMLDVQWFGLNPGWHHLTSLLFHLANTLLLFAVLRRISGAIWRSAFVAALFALHPLHVESVAWVAERKDVLSTLFFLLTLGAYARWAEGRKAWGVGREVKSEIRDPKSEGNPKFDIRSPNGRLPIANRRSGYYWLAVGLFALGLMSKPMLVTLPFVLLLLDFWPLGRFGASITDRQSSVILGLFREKLPFFALAAASCVVTYLVQDKAGATISLNVIPLWWRLSNALLSYAIYLRKTIWPLDLAVTYPFTGLQAGSNPWLAGQLLATALLLLAISAIALWRLKRQPWLATGWFWYLGTLVPVIGLVQIGDHARADRYTYIPLIGVFICLVWSTAELMGGCRRRPQEEAQPQDSALGSQPASRDTGGAGEAREPGSSVLAGAIGTLVLIACVVATRMQLRYWHDDFALFGHALAVVPDGNATAHYTLGLAFTRQGKYEPAVAHFRATAQADPSYPQLHVMLGRALMLMGKPEQAAEEYRAALRVNPGDAATLDALGQVLLALGRSDEALAQYTALAQIAPASPVPAFGKGTLLLAQGRPAEAETNFLAALRRRPDYAEALIGLATSLARQHRFAQAEARFREALRLAPTNALAHIFLGQTLLWQGRDTEASACFANALRLAPDLPARNVQSAKTDLRYGQFETAVSRLVAVLQLLPDHAEALNELAWIRATAPEARWRNGSEAVRLAERACRLSGGKEAAFYATLDAAYAEAGRFEEAIRTAEKVREMAQAAGQEEIARGAEQRLALYRQHQPYRLETRVTAADRRQTHPSK